LKVIPLPANAEQFAAKVTVVADDIAADFAHAGLVKLIREL
jgi:hypothetical protein